MPMQPTPGLSRQLFLSSGPPPNSFNSPNTAAAPWVSPAAASPLSGSLSEQRGELIRVAVRKSAAEAVLGTGKLRSPSAAEIARSPYRSPSVPVEGWSSPAEWPLEWAEPQQFVHQVTQQCICSASECARVRGMVDSLTAQVQAQEAELTPVSYTHLTLPTKRIV
eukprot:TRINITY_DN35844_c0_g1_i1.p1 TRINITY_DN35844_c0_g1~~TRINITY_DN35844_c0_g1_i1.p1  ORF type:complete len:165 (-),score=16.75 TRINITY_DN35844_c0_g1_i1:81-575(-)